MGLTILCSNIHVVTRSLSVSLDGRFCFHHRSGCRKAFSESMCRLHILHTPPGTEGTIGVPMLSNSTAQDVLTPNVRFFCEKSPMFTVYSQFVLLESWPHRQLGATTCKPSLWLLTQSWHDLSQPASYLKMNTRPTSCHTTPTAGKT